MKNWPIKKIFKVALAIKILGFIMVATGVAFFDANFVLFVVLASIGGVVMLGGCLVDIIYYRCPHCGFYLGKERLPYGYCKFCGGPIDNDETHDDSE